jgi:hypothetical protein
MLVFIVSIVLAAKIRKKTESQKKTAAKEFSCSSL